MSRNRNLARAAAVAATLGLVTIASAGSAFAHVQVDPEEAPKGDYAKVTFRVPNEKDDAGTVKLKVTFPEQYPLSSVRTSPMPGWTAQVEKVKLNPPVEVAGSEVDEAVRSVTWTAQPGTRIGPDEFDEFELNLGTLPTNTDRLVLPAEQTYDNGEVVRWDTPPPAEGGEEPEHPAPALTLVDSAGGHSHSGSAHSEGAAHSGPSGSGAQPAADDTARLLGGTGLGVGALALGIGIGALLRGRKGKSA